MESLDGNDLTYGYVPAVERSEKPADSHPPPLADLEAQADTEGRVNFCPACLADVDLAHRVHRTCDRHNDSWFQALTQISTHSQTTKPKTYNLQKFHISKRMDFMELL